MCARIHSLANGVLVLVLVLVYYVILIPELQRWVGLWLVSMASLEVATDAADDIQRALRSLGCDWPWSRRCFFMAQRMCMGDRPLWLPALDPVARQLHTQVQVGRARKAIAGAKAARGQPSLGL